MKWDACPDGFQLKSGTCTPCTATGCNSCNSDLAKCDKCLDGFQFDKVAGTCIVCTQPDCKSCNADRAKCDSCVDGFSINDGDGTCADCTAANCETCNSDLSKCDACPDGFQHNAIEGTCNACTATNCQSCNVDLAQCDTCPVGLQFTADSSSCCADPSCQSCSIDPAKCDTCPDGSHMDTGTGSCQACTVSMCKSCAADLTTCTDCPADSHLTEVGTCCKASNCNTCSDDISTCELCPAGHQLENDGTTCCKATGCKTCSVDTTKCDSCPDGNQFNTISGTCTVCTTANCKTCNVNRAKCDVCADGFQFNKGAGTRIACTATDCTTCNTDTTKCDACVEGFKSLDDGNCKEYRCKWDDGHDGDKLGGCSNSCESHVKLEDAQAACEEETTCGGVALLGAYQLRSRMGVSPGGEKSWICELTPCNAEDHCSGRGTTSDEDKSDGCRCNCAPGFGLADCSKDFSARAEDISGMGIVMGELNSNECPEGSSRIEDETECKASSVILPGRNYEGTVNWPTAPKGCHVYNKDALIPLGQKAGFQIMRQDQSGVYLNKHAKGSGDQKSKLICAQVCTAKETEGYILSDCDTSSGPLTSFDCELECSVGYSGTARAACSSDGSFTFLGCEAPTLKVVSGNCTARGDGCVTSPNYPNDYAGDDKCVMKAEKDIVLTVPEEAFLTESYFDKMMVNDVAYEGSTGPDGVMPSSGQIVWTTDGAVQRSGWVICQTTTTTTTQALWEQTGSDNSQCVKINIVSVADRTACQTLAMDYGHKFYQYAASSQKCATSATCDDPITSTGEDWKIYQATCKIYSCSTQGFVKMSDVDALTDPSDQTCCEATCEAYICAMEGYVKNSVVLYKTAPTEEKCCQVPEGGLPPKDWLIVAADKDMIVTTTIKGIDYDKLTPDMKVSLKFNLGLAFSWANGVPLIQYSIKLEKGSVLVTATIMAEPGQKFLYTKAPRTDDLVTAVMGVPDIGNAIEPGAEVTATTPQSVLFKQGQTQGTRMDPVLVHVDMQALWDLFAASQKCVADEAAFVNVTDQMECQALAMEAHHKYYQYSDTQKKCATSATCDSPITDNSSDWNVYEGSMTTQEFVTHSVIIVGVNFTKLTPSMKSVMKSKFGILYALSYNVSGHQCTIGLRPGSVLVTGSCYAMDGQTLGAAPSESDIYDAVMSVPNIEDAIENISEVEVIPISGVDTPSGVFCPTGTGYDGNACTTCSAGTMFWESACVTCRPGTIQDKRGQSSCKPCTGGTYSHWNETEEGFIECLPCQAGRYGHVYAGLRGTSECLLCDLGTFQSDQGKTECSICPLGKYTVVAGASECRDCEPGTHGASTSDGRSICTACESGTYSEAGWTACKECDAGYQLKDNACIPCDAGSVWNNDSYACVKCEAGTYAESGWTDCKVCDAGSIPDKNAGSCDACPAGTFQTFKVSLSRRMIDTNGTIGTNDTNGTIDAVDPVDPVDSVDSIDPVDSVDTIGAASCEYCPVGTYSKLGWAACKECEPGYIPQDNQSCIPVNMCDGGKYANMETFSCEECLAGTYSEFGMTGCDECPANAVADPGSTQCTYCLPLHIPNPDRTKCLLMVENMLQVVIGVLLLIVIFFAIRACCHLACCVRCRERRRLRRELRWHIRRIPKYQSMQTPTTLFRHGPHSGFTAPIDAPEFHLIQAALICLERNLILRGPGSRWCP